MGRRVSSASTDYFHGSDDWRELAPRSTLELAKLRGPGRIDHIWFTLGPDKQPLPPGWWRKIELRITWDRDTTASVQVPLGCFFCQFNEPFQPINTVPVRVQGTENRGWNSYWPMPFRNAARVELVNPTDGALGKVYFQIDWTDGAAVDGDELYFHAQYREANPHRPKQGDYILADIKGRGHYVGTIYSVKLTPARESMIESDERFFVDGARTPTSSGTGTEDAYGGAWGIQTETGLWSGAMNTNMGFLLYRWHLPDPIAFRKSLRVSWENWGLAHGAFSEVEYNPSSVALWYQAHRSSQPDEADE